MQTPPVPTYSIFSQFLFHSHLMTAEEISLGWQIVCTLT